MKALIVSTTLMILLGGSLGQFTRSPILFFPGITDSVLNVVNRNIGQCNTHGSAQRVWINELRLMQCGSQELRLVHNKIANHFEDSPGVTVKVPSFGGVNGVEYLGLNQQHPYLHQFLQFFESRGYTRGVSISTAPYDWRLAADELDRRGYFNSVKRLIENMYRKNSRTAVTLVAHSMGGLVSHHFLTHYTGIDQAWKNTYIHAWVTLSGAWSGGVKTLGRVISGSGLEIFNNPAKDIPLAGLLVPIVRTLESIPWVFPRQSVFHNQVLVSTPSRNYTATEYNDLFNAIGYNEGYDMYQHLTQTVTPTFPSPGVRAHCFYGVGVETPETYVYGQDLTAQNSIGLQPVHIVKGDGDGTVNLASSEICHKWSIGWDIRRFHGIDHSKMVEDPRVLLQVGLVTHLPRFSPLVG